MLHHAVRVAQGVHGLSWISRRHQRRIVREYSYGSFVSRHIPIDCLLPIKAVIGRIPTFHHLFEILDAFTLELVHTGQRFYIGCGYAILI